MNAGVRRAVLCALVCAAVWLLASGGWALQAPEAPRQVAYEHMIRLKVLKVTPVERTDRLQILKLQVERHYGKIDYRSLERARKHETQRFTILFPASADAVVKGGDIIDYRIARYLSLGEAD